HDSGSFSSRVRVSPFRLGDTTQDTPRERRLPPPAPFGPRRATSGTEVLAVAADRGELLGLQRRTPDEGAGDVLTGHDVRDAAGLDRTSVEHPYPVGGLLRVQRDELLPDGAADLLGILRRGHLTGTDGPHRFVGDDDGLGLLGRDALEAAGDLRGDVGDVLPRLTHLQPLTDADDG